MWANCGVIYWGTSSEPMIGQDRLAFIFWPMENLFNFSQFLKYFMPCICSIHVFVLCFQKIREFCFPMNGLKIMNIHEALAWKFQLNVIKLIYLISKLRLALAYHNDWNVKCKDIKIFKVSFVLHVFSPLFQDFNSRIQKLSLDDIERFAITKLRQTNGVAEVS